jgi:preprotein translocase subunit SecG
MLTVIIVIHLLIVLAMIGTVLLQKSEGGGLGIGSTGGFLTSRGTANVLTRTTAMLAAAFFVTSLVLSILASWERKPRSVLQPSAPAGQTLPGGAPVPLGQGGGVLDTLRGGQQPPAPSGEPGEPRVPQSR